MKLQMGKYWIADICHPLKYEYNLYKLLFAFSSLVFEIIVLFLLKAVCFNLEFVNLNFNISLRATTKVKGGGGFTFNIWNLVSN